MTQPRTVSPTVTGRSPRTFSCHYCPFVDADPEVTFAHLFTHPEADRRRGHRATRKAAA